MGLHSDRVRSEFELLVVEHHVQVRAFVRSLGVDPDWVDDIAQEAFLTAYREWKTFDPARDFGKWLRGIAANIVRSELRKDARRQRILRSELTELLVERVAEAKQRLEPIALEMIRDCLGKLPSRNRELVQARYRDGESAPSLAERFHLSSDNVRQLLLRIRLQLKKCVELQIAEVENE
ncbi:MAG: sigma-70 family RNA polymerase sigma factor [Planctomycetia bacterium]|nr:sigma-70 family RNA polymerase sigma factor [Planctomycetia bacterium]